MQLVRILELVHQDVLESPLVVRTDGVVVAQQFVAAQQQLGKIDHAFALALRVVSGVEIGHAAVVFVGDFQIARAQALLLGPVDEVLDVLGREFLVVDIERLEQAFDGGQLILRIQNLERLR